jgi:hypothetical protein
MPSSGLKPQTVDAISAPVCTTSNTQPKAGFFCAFLPPICPNQKTDSY